MHNNGTTYYDHEYIYNETNIGGYLRPGPQGSYDGNYRGLLEQLFLAGHSSNQ